ncbi:UDP-N-acetylmuramoyl-tripeptide-D-alanyl-D-alanine ligase [Candidatus Saccharibacteria bacterium RAAC3_TM7_1]|nr:UDP-N-acetylmuramoyl-tripeptide-D-alanyl-D-alanine ligase [Candidatus Saccharibacteria bacterium RAAC3_TM7_1]HCZ28450.1 hypothetical protein [Candidatus Saccharibacteria bacterium]
MFKRFVQKKLESYVRAYFKAHPEVRLIAVGGSVGKTSTKTAIATVLAKSLRVRMEDSNHNTHLSAPLGILGITYPENVHGVIAWLQVFRAAKKRIHQPSDVDVIVQELGTDHPGEIAHFGTYLKPFLGVVTAVTPEHMEFLGSIETVAQEELTLANFSQAALINRDDIDGRFSQYLTNPEVNTYGTTGSAEYRIEVKDFDINHGYEAYFYAPDLKEGVVANVRVLGEHSLRPVAAAVAVALKLGMDIRVVAEAVEDIVAVNGRMNVLRGVQDSILIDDTYNSSPASASAALQTLYNLQAPQRIAILGDMNELGSSSQTEHETLGTLCDPSLLAWVVTIGPESEKYLAPAARARGCQVKSFRSALQAGGFVNGVVESGAVVLAKGSQNNVYAEEALKILLHETSDDHQLVRQGAQWQQTKEKFFGNLTE